jgi:histidine triad (HIT) family protein
VVHVLAAAAATATQEALSVKRISKAEALARVQREDVSARSCAMCAAAKAPIVASSEHAFAVLDRYAARPGHVLVVARRHEERVTALALAEYLDLQRLAYALSGAVERVLSPKRVYVAALGSPELRATSFPHVHLHVVPLANGGEEDRPAGVFTWERGVWVFEDDGEEQRLRDALREAFLCDAS